MTKTCVPCHSSCRLAVHEVLSYLTCAYCSTEHWHSTLVGPTKHLALMLDQTVSGCSLVHDCKDSEKSDVVFIFFFSLCFLWCSCILFVYSRTGCSGPTNWDCTHCVNYKVFNDTEHDFALSPNTTQLTTAFSNITSTTPSTGVIILESTSTTTTSGPVYINYTVVSNETGEVITIVERTKKEENKTAVSGLDKKPWRECQGQNASSSFYCCPAQQLKHCDGAKI